jgi:hypothetical protein
MPKLLPAITYLLRAGVLACVALLLSPASFAQGERWYRVELLVFTNEEATAATAEQWDPTPSLAYPGAMRFLVDPRQVRANLARYQAEHPGIDVDNTVDEYGRQIIAPRVELISPMDQAEAGLGVAPGPGNTQATPQAGKTPRPMSPVYAEPVVAATLAPETVAPVITPSLPEAYTLLGNAQQEFRGKAAYMQKLGRHRTLFHESWVQPLEVEDRSLPIVLDHSGDTGQWPQLQGSVKLYLSRYAHLETNLWLNTNGSYLPGQWHMPAPPLGPPSLVIEEPVLVEELDTSVAQAPVIGEAITVENPQPAEALAEAALPGPVYPYRHAVTLQQKRRMRSGEVHYIDHPMFGIVIKLTPLSAEDLAEIAAAEFVASTQSP